METREIDSRLQRYTAAEHQIGANLQELEQHSVYQLLMTDVLTGKTRAELRHVTEADPDLWDLYMLLGSTLDKARRIRGTGTRVKAAERQQLDQILRLPSVLIDIDQIPLSRRGLTTGALREERLTIEALIDRMRGLYEPLRDVVTHAERVLREVLPRLNSAESSLARLRSEAASLSLDTLDIDQIDETIKRIQDLALTDPLSIPTDARLSLDQAIAEAGARIAKARTSHDELASDMANASRLLDECRDLITHAQQYRDESLRKIASPIGLRQPPSMQAIDGPRGLGARLDPLLSSTQPWQVVRHQLDDWTQSATRFRDQLTRVEAANRAPLDKRNELRGRLNAFRAKMAATGNSEDSVLRDMSAEAHNELFTSPTELARAERLVAEFGNRLGQQ